jgi:hypothetical protein
VHVPIKGVQRRSKRSGILFGKRFLITVQNAEEGKKAGNSSRNTSGCTMHMQRPPPPTSKIETMQQPSQKGLKLKKDNLKNK